MRSRTLSLSRVLRVMVLPVPVLINIWAVSKRGQLVLITFRTSPMMAMAQMSGSLNTVVAVTTSDSPSRDPEPTDESVPK